MAPADWEDGTLEPSGQYVQSLARGLAVIRVFDSDNPEMTLSDVAQRAGLSRATARRFLLTLVELGYVRTDGKLFALTARVLELGYNYLSSLSLPELAQPHLESLSATVHESTSASVLDGQDIVYVARVPVRRIMTVSINLGTRFPAYATSMGRAILAFLREDELARHLEKVEFTRYTDRTVTNRDELLAELAKVRERGWSLVDQELEIGLRSIAAPVKDRNGQVLAAINVSAQTEGATVEYIVENYVPPLLKTAADIDRDFSAANGVRHSLSGPRHQAAR